MKSISIPEDVLISIKIPEKDVENVLTPELATALYQKGVISLGKARKLAGMSKWEFIEKLGKRKIERHYTERELEEDLAFAKSNK
jgi:predicted HTH domain antitoxin